MQLKMPLVETLNPSPGAKPGTHPTCPPAHPCCLLDAAHTPHLPPCTRFPCCYSPPTSSMELHRHSRKGFSPNPGVLDQTYKAGRQAGR